MRALPLGLLSRTAGRLARFELPGALQRRLNLSYARWAGVELSEATRPPEAYRSLADFFARGLKEGSRRWPEDPDRLGSPVDGVIGALGTIRDGTALQAKGITYRIDELLGCPETAERFEAGAFLTLYLAPRHYHGVHAPCSGTLRRALAIPGRLLPVNLQAVGSVPDLFPRNERLTAYLESGAFELAVVAVGAFNVGSISADFDGGWGEGQGTGVGRGITNRAGPRARKSVSERRYEPPLEVERGDQLMTFHLGSTVVLLIRGTGAGGSPVLRGDLTPGAEIRLGAPILQAPIR